MNAARIAELKPILENNDLNSAFLSAKSFEELQAIFRRNGADITEAELTELAQEIGAQTFGELDESQLAHVAGGFTGILLWGGAAVVAYGASWAIGRVIRNKSGVCG